MHWGATWIQVANKSRKTSFPLVHDCSGPMAEGGPPYTAQDHWYVLQTTYIHIFLWTGGIEKRRISPKYLSNIQILPFEKVILYSILISSNLIFEIITSYILQLCTATMHSLRDLLWMFFSVGFSHWCRLTLDIPFILGMYSSGRFQMFNFASTDSELHPR